LGERGQFYQDSQRNQGIFQNILRIVAGHDVAKLSSGQIFW